MTGGTIRSGNIAAYVCMVLVRCTSIIPEMIRPAVTQITYIIVCGRSIRKWICTFLIEELHLKRRRGSRGNYTANWWWIVWCWVITAEQSICGIGTATATISTINNRSSACTTTTSISSNATWIVDLSGENGNRTAGTTSSTTRVSISYVRAIRAILAVSSNRWGRINCKCISNDKNNSASLAADTTWNTSASVITTSTSSSTTT